MNADPANPADTAWMLYNILLGLTNQLWEAYELDFLMRHNASLAVQEGPSADHNNDLDFSDEDIPF